MKYAALVVTERESSAFAQPRDTHPDGDPAPKEIR